MPRIEGVDAKRAGLFVRFVYWMVKRKIGRVVAPVRITAHVPRLLRAYGMMEVAQDKLRSVDVRLKALCQIKCAMRIGCPF